MKKFIISSDSLGKAFKKLSLAVNTKSTIPVTKNMLCRVTKDQVELITTDLELTISSVCPAETGDHEFEVLLPFDFVSRIVSFSKGTPITIEHPSTRKVRILGDGDEYDITVEKLEEFPKVPSVSKMSFLNLDLNFVDILSRAVATVGSDESRPAMSYVCVDARQKELFVVGTDAHTLYRHRVPVGWKEPEKLLVSARMIKAIEGMVSVEMTWNKSQICMSGETLTVWCRRFDGVYPNYEAAIPSQPANLLMDRLAIVDALHKSLLSSTQPNCTVIHLKSSEGRIHFECDDKDMGRCIRVDKAGEYTGRTTAISVNGKKMLTVLGQLTCEKVNLHIDKPEKAILVSTAEDTDYLGMIMPIQINS